METRGSRDAMMFYVGKGCFPHRDLHAAVGGTAIRLSRSAIRDLGLISHRTVTRPPSPPHSLTECSPEAPATTELEEPAFSPFAYALFGCRGRESATPRL